MYKIKLLDFKLIFSLCLIPIIFMYGINFGINGTDIYIYAEKNLQGLQEYFTSTPHPLFNAYVILLFALGQGSNPFAFLITGIISIFLSHIFIVKNIKNSLISWTLFLLTIQGFNTSFNSIRTGFALLLVSFSYSLLNKFSNFNLRINLSLVIGSLGHIQTFIIFFLYNLRLSIKSLLKIFISLKINKKIIIFSILILLFILFLTSMYSDKLSSYVLRAIERKEIETYRIALFYPFYFSLISLVNLRKNNKINEKEGIFNKEFIKNWIFVGWFAWGLSILGFPLVFERVSVFSLFFTLPLFTIKSNVYEFILFAFTLFLRLSII